MAKIMKTNQNKAAGESLRFILGRILNFCSKGAGCKLFLNSLTFVKKN